MNVIEQNSFFFIGVAGSGMSALAHYLSVIGKEVGGSDRYFGTSSEPEVRNQLEHVGIKCYPQDGSGITNKTDIVVISTAVEENNTEYQKAIKMGKTIITRPALLALIANSKRTIAIGGTAGKSTTTAMVFHILNECGLSPSMINGAGLTSLQKTGITGNAWVGKSDIMVIEADESNGTIIDYTPEISVVLNMGRDHKEDNDLLSLFKTFRENTKRVFIVNDNHPLIRTLSVDRNNDFGVESGVGYLFANFQAKGFSISFTINDVSFSLPLAGMHNMENACAAVACVGALGVSLEQSAKALQSFEGIYRRLQFVGNKNGIAIIDDFAHNPNEVATAISACQSMGRRVFAWFQPHGFGPLRFMHSELARLVLDVMRPNDVFLMSDVFYAGGTVNKDINSDIVTDEIVANGKNAIMIPDRNNLANYLHLNAQEGDVIILMGARDPTLADFAQYIYTNL